jgi:hypothetical protein
MEPLTEEIDVRCLQSPKLLLVALDSKVEQQVAVQAELLLLLQALATAALCCKWCHSLSPAAAPNIAASMCPSSPPPNEFGHFAGR